MPARIALLLIAACYCPSSSANDVAADDEQAIREVHDTWIAAYTSGDVDSLERFYLPSTVLMPDGRPTFRGWDEIRSFFSPGFERFDYAASAELESIEVSGDLGAAVGVVSVTLTPKGGGEPASRDLRYLIVFRKTAEGEWKILYDMDNLVP